MKTKVQEIIAEQGFKDYKDFIKSCEELSNDLKNDNRFGADSDHIRVKTLIQVATEMDLIEKNVTK